MNITMDKQTLFAALTKVSAIVSRRNTIAILSHVLIDAAKGGQVTFRATNLDIEATVTIKANVETPGATTVSAEMLLNIAKNAADGADIVLTLGDKLQVKSGRSRFNLAVLPPVDFPTFASFEPVAEFEVVGKDLAAMMGRVAFAQCLDATRHYMNGVHLFGEGGQLGVVATNGHALAEMRVDGGAGSFSGTIPTAMVSEIMRAFSDDASAVRVSISQSKIQIVSPTMTITSKLIDGQFPPYERVIPSGPKNVAVVDMDALANAMRRVSSVDTGSKTRSTRLTFSDGVIGISARGEDADGADEIECEYTDEAQTIGFNSAYVISALQSCASDVVRIRFEDSMSPVLIEPINDERLRVVVMPLRA